MKIYILFTLCIIWILSIATLTLALFNIRGNNTVQLSIFASFFIITLIAIIFQVMLL